MRLNYAWAGCAIAVLALKAAPAAGQIKEAAVVESAAVVLKEVMALPAKQIPLALLADAHGIAIIPDVIKGGFVVGGRHGRGLVLVRDEHGEWKPPTLITLTGGSVGFQAGIQSTDVVLVFKTEKSVEGLLTGKFTIGADAAAAAGPIGRQASAATDEKLKAEIYSYSRSRGFFAGVALDGSVLQVDQLANAMYYRAGQGDPNARLPESAATLMNLVAFYTASIDGDQPDAVQAVASDVQQAPAAVANDPTEPLRLQLGAASARLAALLDETWQRYLVLPAAVYPKAAQQPPRAEALLDALRRFDAVAADARYRSLSQRPEFQSTHELLRAYLQQRAAQASGRIQLPPPPSR